MVVLIFTSCLVSANCTRGQSITNSTTQVQNQPSSEHSPRALSKQTKINSTAIEIAFPELSFNQLVYLTNAGDGSDRLFVLERLGQIKVFNNTPLVTHSTTFLDLSSKINSSGSEEGLLGLAFDPNYVHNGYFYVYYSIGSPRRTVISRFSVNSGNPNLGDPDSELVIMVLDQPYKNHNGGHIAFGPDGFLYIGLGDGGGMGDPLGNAQDLGSLLGSILRIDVNTSDSASAYKVPFDNPFLQLAGARPEIWAYGLRNPWKFSFDQVTGWMWAGDVGQDTIEEINIIKPGMNYGWNIMEGTSCFSKSGCNTTNIEPPISEYNHELGCSVTGGYVYRGNRLPWLKGSYIYGDFCSGRIWALDHINTREGIPTELAKTQLRVSSFGEDESGELYVLSIDGLVYQLSGN